MIELKERLKSYEPLWENWYIDSYVGKGSSSVVYKIKQDRFGEIGYGALKIISISIDDEVGASYEQRLRSLNEKKQRAKNEINNMYKLKNCAAVVHCLNHVIKDIKDDNGQNIGFDILIRMEYYTCLSKYMMEKGGSLTQKEVENLALQIGSGIKAVHALNIIHRDIKPENFFIDEKGNYLLGDFGVSKQLSNETSCSTVAGTQPYIAPEIYKVGANRHYTQTADIYSFGIVLYTLLNNNCLPLTNEQSSANEIQSAIDCRLAGDRFPEPINGSRALKSIVMKACAYDERNRYQSMEDMMKAMISAFKAPDDYYMTEYADKPDYQDMSVSRKPQQMHQKTSPVSGGYRYDNIGNRPPQQNVRNIQPYDRIAQNPQTKQKKSGSKMVLAGCLGMSFFVIVILLLVIIWLFVLTPNPDNDSTDNNEVTSAVSQQAEEKSSNNETTNKSDKQENDSDIVYAGNANLVNGGDACCIGDTYYYCDDTLYSVDKNGKKKTVFNDRAYYMSCYNGKLYFKAQDSDDNWGFYSVSSDGSDLSKIYNGSGNEFTIYDDKIYFRIGSDDSSQLHCMELDGSGDRVIASINEWYMNIYNDKIYYSDVGKNRNIYQMNIDGSDVHLVYSGTCYDLCVADDSLFFSEGSSKRQLYRLDMDTQYVTPISNVPYAEFNNWYDGRLYFKDGSGNISSCNINGDDLTLVKETGSGESVKLINCVPGKITYRTGSKNATLHIIDN